MFELFALSVDPGAAVPVSSALCAAEFHVKGQRLGQLCRTTSSAFLWQANVSQSDMHNMKSSGDRTYLSDMQSSSRQSCAVLMTHETMPTVAPCALAVVVVEVLVDAFPPSMLLGALNSSRARNRLLGATEEFEEFETFEALRFVARFPFLQACR